MSKQVEQSVKDRLKNIAKQSDKDFNFVCIQYMQERFLARLAKSEYQKNFVLKGALLLLAYNIPVVRPSKDIDFKGEHTSNDIDQIRSLIKNIAEIELADGVNFISDEIEIHQITEDAEYGGLRVKIWATVGGDRHRLQIDIGFGDTIIDGPVDMDYPAMLNFSSPNIKAYSIESSMAEKLETIVSLGALSSRMKDYFDVVFLINNHDLEKERLKKAINSTFIKRNTPKGDFKYIFNKDFIFDKDMDRQWKAFLNRNSIDSQKSFNEIVQQIEDYLSPILDF